MADQFANLGAVERTHKANPKIPWLATAVAVPLAALGVALIIHTGEWFLSLLLMAMAGFSGWIGVTAANGIIEVCEHGIRRRGHEPMSMRWDQVKEFARQPVHLMPVPFLKMPKVYSFTLESADGEVFRFTSNGVLDSDALVAAVDEHLH
jgi:hypothetical protein